MENARERHQKNARMGREGHGEGRSTGQQRTREGNQAKKALPKEQVITFGKRTGIGQEYGGAGNKDLGMGREQKKGTVQLEESQKGTRNGRQASREKARIRERSGLRQEGSRKDRKKAEWERVKKLVECGLGGSRKDAGKERERCGNRPGWPQGVLEKELKNSE